MKIGLKAKAYWGVSGTTASAPIPRMKDCSLGGSTASADGSNRDSGGFRLKVPTLKEMTVEMTIVADETSNPALVAFRQAWLENGAVALLVLDKESGEGPDADFCVTKFDRAEGLEDVIAYSITFEPTLSSRAPQWVAGS